MDTDRLLDQFESYTKILKKYFPDKGMDRFLEDFGTRLATCPRALESNKGGEYGDLVKYQMKIAVRAKEISKITQEECDSRSAVRVALVHELGKLGDEENELFVSQESQWHRDKLGQNFKYNEMCNKMTVAHRTLYLLQKYEIQLSQDEWITVMTCQGAHFPENAFYANSTSPLSGVINFAKTLTQV